MPFAPRRSASCAYSIATRVGPPAPARIGTLPLQVSVAVRIDVRVVALGQREEFARAAGDEQRRRAVGREPFEALGVSIGAEIALCVEVGDGEGQQAFGNDLL